MADCQNCGCSGCKCPRKDFLLVTYSYVVDDRNPFRSFFNQEGTPMHLVTTALRLAQDFVVVKSGMGRDCWQLLCEQTHKVRTEADYCLPPCLAALRDKLIWCIVSQAKYEYIKERGHDNADNARDEKLDIKERMILFDFYKQEALDAITAQKFEDFLMNAKVKDYDADSPNNDSRCFPCFAVADSVACETEENKKRGGRSLRIAFT